jgi:aminotransferase
MTREALKHGAVNLSQGFPDFAAPEDIKRKAMEAIANDVNQYAITWGSKDFRDAITRKTKWHLGLDIDPETEITVTCGSTEGMIAAMMATVDPGDEVIVFEPFYENYAPDAILSDATPRYVSLRAPEWSFDPQELRAAFNEKTKAIIVCNPNNPTGKVFSQDEMEYIAQLCQEFDTLCFTDEIYEHIIYDGLKQISIATLDPALKARSIVVNGFSKAYAMTGWRVGYCIAPPEITSGIRKVHDFDGRCGSATTGRRSVCVDRCPRSTTTSWRVNTGLGATYSYRLEQNGFSTFVPDGAYYIMTDISAFGLATTWNSRNT